MASTLKPQAKYSVPPNWQSVYSGKVRDIYEIDPKTWALVASDRISAFDWILPDYVSDKGKILTQLSKYWFERLQNVLPNHWLAAREMDLVPVELAKRAMLVKKVKIFPFEFIVRGYLAGSGWKSYVKEGKAGVDHKLREGLKRGDQLPECLLTPTTKAMEKGSHDEDVSWWTVEKELGKAKADHIHGSVMQIFKTATEHLEERGLILVDTKFELGEDEEGRIVLADEVLTPDSSRFWWRRDWEKYQAAGGKEELPALDKQVVRDYLEKTAKWDKKPPVPILPPALIEETRATYIKLFKAVAGRDPDI
ncbi:MAG: phosphoribosylaminoimidazolesuccinocarboxamide synthase [Elusimicrobia bacterium]|nr:phosphoribosylaminoimidazolesuccinocarboxamide synthase [Elusimicrobiota bacterium]